MPHLHWSSTVTPDRDCRCREKHLLLIRSGSAGYQQPSPRLVIEPEIAPGVPLLETLSKHMDCLAYRPGCCGALTQRVQHHEVVLGGVVTDTGTPHACGDQLAGMRPPSSRSTSHLVHDDEKASGRPASSSRLARNGDAVISLRLAYVWQIRIPEPIHRLGSQMRSIGELVNSSPLSSEASVTG